MAKSLRSKRKRMFRSIKRKRYAAKELIRLKNMLGLPITESEAVVPPLHVVEYKFKKHSKVRRAPDNDRRSLNFKFTEKGNLIPLEPSDDEAEEMNSESEGEHNPVTKIEVNESQGENASKEGATSMDHSQKKVYDKKTMRDESGNFPPWFTQKDIKKQAKKMKLRKKIMKKKEILRAINEKQNKKLIRRKPKRRKVKETTEEKSKEMTEEKSKEVIEEKSKEVTEKSKIVEQSNSDEKQSMEMEL
ncbi:Protein of unknown function [Gryllus bimaculatus]|nr:Protein of unknown function [Gryllus bimaculatus]